MFALAFICSFQIEKWIYKKEGLPQGHFDSLLVYMMIGTTRRNKRMELSLKIRLVDSIDC